MRFFFFQAEDGIRDIGVTGVQTCALPIYPRSGSSSRRASSTDSRPSTSVKTTGSAVSPMGASYPASLVARTRATVVAGGGKASGGGKGGNSGGAVSFKKKKNMRTDGTPFR